MLDLPKSTEFGRIIPKDRVYKSGGANRELQDLFAKQVERVRWQNKIAPDTANIGAGDTVTEIEVVEVTQTVETLDRRILPLIVKAIPYRLLFALNYDDATTYAVHYNGTTYASGTPPRLLGNDLDAVWENYVRQIAGFAEDGAELAEQAEAAEQRQKLAKQIAALEKKAASERQPRRKWELVEEIKRLKAELEVKTYDTIY